MKKLLEGYYYLKEGEMLKSEDKYFNAYRGRHGEWCRTADVGRLVTTPKSYIRKIEKAEIAEIPFN